MTSWVSKLNDESGTVIILYLVELKYKEFAEITGLTNFEGGMKNYDGLRKSVKKILLYWVVSAKKPDTRQRRILEIAENAGKNLKSKQFR